MLCLSFLASRWSYFTDADPTGGHTKYLSYPDAAKAGLAYVQNNQAILAADSKNDLPFGTNRSSYVAAEWSQEPSPD